MNGRNGGWRAAVRGREQRGRDDLARFGREPSSLPRLPLGRERQHGPGLLLLQSAALAARVPPTVLACVGPLALGRRRAWFRFVYRYAYWYGVRRAAERDTWRRLKRGVSILMYHAIGARGERPTRYVIPVTQFERQMKWLKRRGYAVMRLEDYVACLREHRLPPPKAVVVTLDDGYLDNLTLARPILERLGLPATVFLVSAGGTHNGWSVTDDVAGRPLMRMEDAKGILGGVVSFGAHTRTHPKLPDIPLADAEREVGGSRDELEAALGAPISTFAYPYGRMNAAVRDIVVRAGFDGACAVVPGQNHPSDDVFALRRVEIFGTDRILRFAVTMWLGDVGRRRRHA